MTASCPVQRGMQVDVRADEVAPALLKKAFLFHSDSDTAFMKPERFSMGDFLRLMQTARRREQQLFDEYERERSASAPSQTDRASGPTIYTLTVKCVWGINLAEPCTRVIEMKDTATLMDLHYAIQTAVEFDNDHCFEFFVGRTYQQRAIVFEDGAFDDGQNSDCLSEIRLHRIWPLPEKMKLFYWFDFGDDWKFQITKGRSIKQPEKGVKYPRIVKEIGPNPQQYPDYE